MKLLTRLFGTSVSSRGGDPTRPPSTLPSIFEKNHRRDLLRVVLRDTLQRHGVPSDWIAAELLTSTLVNGDQGLHWRLHLRHWDPRLLTHGVALQNALLQHLISLDPTASEWLTGVSWQFVLADESHCPAMPPPTAWTGSRPALRAKSPEHDVESARADLNRWLSKRDSEFPKQLDALPPNWAPTQPAEP